MATGRRIPMESGWGGIALLSLSLSLFIFCASIMEKGGARHPSGAGGEEGGGEPAGTRDEGPGTGEDSPPPDDSPDPLGEMIRYIDGGGADMVDSTVIRRIAIDPGHGGEDSGAVYGGFREKDIVLEIARILRDTLEIRVEGLKVFLTREDDAFIPLGERARMAAKADADLFISLHCNSSPKRETRGIETYYLNNATDEGAKRLEEIENAPLKGVEDSVLSLILNDLKIEDRARRSRPLALHLHRGVLSEMREILSEREYPNLGIKTALFHVLLGCRMPAVLIECGFLSNPGERENLKSIYFQEKIAKGIVSGLIEYMDWIKHAR